MVDRPGCNHLRRLYTAYSSAVNGSERDLVSTDDNSSFMGRNEFLLRRLHSLSGLVPVGAYMIVHLTVNATVAIDHNLFQKLVHQIHTLGWVLPAVEWTFIFIPILFHAIYGMMIYQNSKQNLKSYQTRSNLRYWLQRISGMVAFFFIMGHVFHMHGWFHFEAWASFAKSWGGMQFSPYNASSTASSAIQNPIVTALYLIGVLSCVLHLSNGIWTMGITWGIWTTPKAQERANYISIAVGGLLSILTIASVVGLHRVDRDKARHDEDAMYETMNDAGWIVEDDHKRATPHESLPAAPPESPPESPPEAPPKKKPADESTGPNPGDPTPGDPTPKDNNPSTDPAEPPTDD